MIQYFFRFTLFLIAFSLVAKIPETCPCDIPSETMQNAIDAAIEIAIKNQKQVLAPVELKKRIIVIETDQQYQAFINPEILWHSQNLYETAQIILRAYDRQGNLLTHEFSGELIPFIEREIDRLEQCPYDEDFR